MARRIHFSILCLGFLGIAAACNGSDDVDGVDAGGADAPNVPGNDSSIPGNDSSVGSDTGTDAPGADTGVDASGTDSGTDARIDAADAADAADAGPLSPGQSIVTLPGTGIPVGKTILVTFVAKDDAGNPVARTGATVVFGTAGGTSVVSIGAVTDHGDGTYTATITGVTTGTKLSVSATIDGVALTTTAASLRVVNPVVTGITASIDAANADALGNAGGKNCPATGMTMWKDMGASAFSGTLGGFANACTGATGSGWAGLGTPADPHRLAFDGVDDNVTYGAVNSVAKHTVLAWIRKAGNGKTGTTGPGGLGLAGVTPIVSKGTSEGESDAIDINYYLGIASTGQLASDYEASTAASVNAPLTGATVLAVGTWYMVGTTLDSANAMRSLYLNGVVDGTLAPTQPPSTGSTANFVVGGARRTTDVAETCPAGSTGCGRFNGDIAIVLTYDRALTPAEIVDNCHAYSARFGMLVCPN